MRRREIAEFPMGVGLKNFRSGLDTFLEANDLHEVCIRIANSFDRIGLEVFAVTFVDRLGKRPSIRPYRNQTKVLVELSRELKNSGGCPILRQARMLGEVFDAKLLQIVDQKDFLAKRYVDELRKQPHKQILVFPIIFGRGMAVFSIGTRDRLVERESIDALKLEISFCVVSLLSKFPELNNLFTQKVLNLLETRCLFLVSGGADICEISEQLGFGEFTIDCIFRSAVKKLNVPSLAAAVSKAQRIGEIHNLEFGDHDFI